MHCPPFRSLAVAVAVLVGLAACATPSRSPSPPPAEPHTSLAPVEIRVTGDPDWVAAGFGSIWVMSDAGVMTRIDPSTARITEAIQVHGLGPKGCTAIGVGTADIWTCDEGDLVRIDPATGVVGAPLSTNKVWSQGRLILAAGRIWVLTGAGDSLVGVSDADGSLSDPIALPAACTDLGAHADIVYVVCEGPGRVLRVDPATATVTSDVAIANPHHVSAAGSGVWVATDEGLLQVDPVTLAVKRTLADVPIGFLGSIRADDTGVWVHRGTPFLTRVDGATGAQTHVINAPFTEGGDVLVEGRYLWASTLGDSAVVRLELPSGG